MTKDKKFKELYDFEKVHTKKGIIKYNNEESKIWDKLNYALTEKEQEEYERIYYGR